MSHLCHYCGTICFVPLAKDIPEVMRRACVDRGVTMLATCEEGKLFDKRLLGYNYEDMENHKPATEEERILKKILEISPVVDGKKWSFFGTTCLWWSSFPDDCDQSEFLPRCPFCGGALDRRPLADFINTAIHQPEHYGPDGLKALLAAYHRNTRTCRYRWERYRVRVKCKQLNG